MSSLTNKDFRTIIKHYKLKVQRTKKKTRRRAVNVLAGKLCRCIKKVKKKKNKRTKKNYKKKSATAIFTSSIFKIPSPLISPKITHSEQHSPSLGGI